MSSNIPPPEDPFLSVVAEYWDDVLDLAGDEQRQRLRDLGAGIAEPDPLDARASLADELLDLLPPGHPILQVMRTGTMYVSSHDDPSAEIARSFRQLQMREFPSSASGQLAVPHQTESDVDQSAAADEFDHEVQARLFDLPFLRPDELRSRNVDPSDHRLIRLIHPDRGVQLPAFQFTKAGTPWQVVQEVNERLDAMADPWGVTCWWVDPHARLDAVPADLLGQGHDAVLLRAATAVGAG